MAKQIITTLLILWLSAPHQAVYAQPAAAAQDWAVVKAVTSGERLLVKLKDGKTVKGELNAVSDQELTLLRKSKPHPFNRDTVAQVFKYAGKPAKGKYTLIGAGIGAAVGAGIGQSQVEPNAEIHLMMGFLIGTGIGALVGLGWGASKRKEVLIYQAR